MASVGPLMSLSIDLDSVDCYRRIHGRGGTPSEVGRHAVLRRCLPRFCELFAAEGVRATFFVVGSDLESDDDGRRIVADVARQGHEIANHTWSHPYDLVRKDPADIAEEVVRAHETIAACAGKAPVGFRAPGYTVSGALLDVLCGRGYLYDSSAFPSAPYYLAKAGIMGALRLVGRPSSSILDTPRVLAAPRLPYRPAVGAPYRRGALPIVELPVSVTPALRLPVIGTSLVASPELLRRRLVSSALGTGFFNLELHGIDLADPAADEFPAELVAGEPALRRSLERKRAALQATLRQAREAGAEVLTLAAAASRYQTSLR